MQDAVPLYLPTKCLELHIQIQQPWSSAVFLRHERTSLLFGFTCNRDKLQCDPYENSYETISVLSCTEFRWFWISWTSTGILSVGHGSQRDVSVFMVYSTRSTVTVTRLGVRTLSCSEGNWVVPDVYYPHASMFLKQSRILHAHLQYIKCFKACIHACIYINIDLHMHACISI